MLALATWKLQRLMQFHRQNAKMQLKRFNYNFATIFNLKLGLAFVKYKTLS